MKTLIIFLITCFIATGAFLGATTASNPYPYFATGWGLWILFFWYVSSNSKRSAQRKEQERLFNEWYRNHGKYMK